MSAFQLIEGGGGRTLAYARKRKDHSHLPENVHPLKKEQQAARSPPCLLLFLCMSTLRAVIRTNEWRERRRAAQLCSKRKNPDTKGYLAITVDQSKHVHYQTDRICFPKDKEVSFMETNTARNRLDDMLERYGEVCTQKVAAQLPGVVPRTIHHWRKAPSPGRPPGRRALHLRVHRIPNRRICGQAKNARPRNMMSESDFFAAARQGR